MAFNFSNISTSINDATRNVNRQVAGVQTITKQVSNSAAQLGVLASAIGSADINQIQNSINTVATTAATTAAANITAQIAGLSNIAATNVNSILATSTALSNIKLDDLRSVGTPVGQSTSAQYNPGEFATNYISVIPKSAAALAYTLGGAYEPATQRVASLEAETVINPGESSSNIPNPLREHNHYNYIITLGILNTDDYNNPTSYRNRKDFKTHIIRSGGGNYATRYQVFDEIGSISGEGAGHAEYYIDELELDALIAPNPTTSVALGTTVSFTVVEPLSMGNFIQSLIGAAKETGGPGSNYMDAPFCLKIEFVGWDEYGNESASLTSPSYIPIKIINMDFNVSGKGSVYEVAAVPYSEYALSDTVNETKTPVSATGNFVWELLNASDSSITAALNQRIAYHESTNVTKTGDRFLIAFPVDLNGASEAITNNRYPNDRIFSTSAAQSGTLGYTDSLFSTKVSDNNRNIVVAPKSDIYSILESYSRDTTIMNEIGLSVIIEETSTGGIPASANQSDSHNETTDTKNRNSPALQPSNKVREQQFDKGTPITYIIESILLSSQYAATNAVKAAAANGTKKWFKIETQVFIDTDPASEIQKGIPSKIYVYNVIPFYCDEAKTAGPNERPQNTEGLKASAKTYNYIYTGKNEDIIDFDINFNNAYMMTAFGGFGQNSAGTRLADAAYATADGQNGAGTEVEISNNSSGSKTSEIGASIVEVAKLNTPSSALRSSDVRLKIAEQFHYNIVNQTTDMVTAEMRIFGDPFYIPQQTGNYYGGPADTSVKYMQSEVFVDVNFKTPFDYQVNGATMELPKIVTQFSGLFTVWAITNSFSNGKFEQTLKLIRRRGQDDTPTTNNKGIIVES